MNCDPKLISYFRDGELSPAQRRVVEDHLRVCPSCTAQLNGFARIAQHVRSGPERPVPASLQASLYRKIAEREEQPLAANWLVNLGRAIIPAAGLASAALAGIVIFRPEMPTPVAVPIAVPASAPVAIERPAPPPVVGSARVDPAPVTVPNVDPKFVPGVIVPPPTRLDLPPAIARLYRSNPTLRARLGDPQPGNKTTPLVEQSFQGGLALWRGDTREIYVLGRGSRWSAYSTFGKLGLLSSLDIAPPPGAFAPQGGFGALWAGRPEVKAKLGWAVYEPRGFGGVIQAFDHGTIVWSPHGLLYVLYDDGSWRSYSETAP
jgi:anti-sigma factor RsiW